jgi:hypothetical protein
LSVAQFVLSKEIAMPVREAPPQPAPSPARMRPVYSPMAYPADKARGAEMDLREPWQRAVFFGGLAGLAAFVLLLRFAA